MIAQTYSPEQVRQELADVLNLGFFESRYDHYVNTQIRDSTYAHGTFYTNTLAEKGLDAAEAELKQWNEARRKSDYASLIEPLARGMLVLPSAEKGPEAKLLRLVNIDHDTTFPHSYELRSGRAFILTNTGAPGCGCMQPKGSELYGPWGRIGIRALVLSYDMYNFDATELGVVMPVRDYYDLDKDRRKSALTVARIGIDGRTDATTLIPDYPDRNLMTGLFAPTGGHGLFVSSGGHFDDAVGFPGATDYLANKLPGLVQYFADLAEALNPSTPHQH